MNQNPSILQDLQTPAKKYKRARLCLYTVGTRGFRIRNFTCLVVFGVDFNVTKYFHMWVLKIIDF